MRVKLAQKLLLAAGRLAAWIDPEHVTITVTQREEGES